MMKPKVWIYRSIMNKATTFDVSNGSGLTLLARVTIVLRGDAF